MGVGDGNTEVKDEDDAKLEVTVSVELGLMNNVLDDGSDVLMEKKRREVGGV